MPYIDDKTNPYNEAKNAATAAIEAQLTGWEKNGHIKNESFLWNHLRGNSLNSVLGRLSLDENEYKKNPRKKYDTKNLNAGLTNLNNDVQATILQIVNTLPNDFDGEKTNAQYTVTTTALKWANLAIDNLVRTGASAAIRTIETINENNKKSLGTSR